MKKIDKAILIIFSIIILILGLAINLLVVGWLDLDLVNNLLKKAITTDPANKILLLSAVLGILLSIKALFWSAPSSNKEGKTGRDVLMQNDNGKLMISINTIESLVTSVVSQFNNVEEIKTNIAVDQENNVSVLVNLIVMKDVIIKDLTLAVQNKIKEAIKKTSDLDVKEVNVRIKNIVSVPEVENKE